MKEKKIYLLTLGALVLGFCLGAMIFEDDGGGTREDRANQIWTCSMHPNVKAPKPGLCPICAMELTPLSSTDASGGPREYSMSEAAKKLAGITTVPVIKKTPDAEVSLFGKVVYDESRKQAVSARFDGRIDKLFVNYTGVRVVKGDHLALFYSPDLLTAQSELLTANKFNNENATHLARDKLRLWGFSPERIDKIESTGKVIDQLTVDAPASGIVTHLHVNEGDYIKTGTRFFQIADTSQVWVLLQAYESDLPWLRYGQKVEFTVESYPSKKFHGIISFIPPDLDSQTRTVSVRVNVPNPKEILKPGMFARALVRTSVSSSGKVIDPSLAGKWISPMHPEVVKDGPGQCDVCGMDLVKAEELGYQVRPADPSDAPLLIPTGAVLNTGKRSIVYVEVPGAEEPTFEGRDILLGPRTGGYYVVEAGLEEGERVVAEGGFVIDSALQIQAKHSMMLPGKAGPLYRRIKMPDSFLSGTDQVLSYFEVQSGLAGDSLERAQAAAEKGAEVSGKVDQQSISPDAAEAWNELRKKLANSFTLIHRSGDIEAARTEFKQLTFLVDEQVRRFGTEYLPVHEMHCPMAFDNSGASWFQADKDLLNPYFGDQMLHCGSIENTLAKGKSFPIPDVLNAPIEKVIQGYFAISASLANDDNKSARSKAGELKQLLAEFGTDQFDLPISQGVWKSQAETLSRNLDAMENQDSIALNRVYFKNLGQGIRDIVTRFGEKITFPINEVHCPMAFNKEGANWLVDSEEIRNPYLGSKMLECGEIIETIHQVKE